mmetsp:Transcript_74205/g.196952  ORF Transcript_74205/g.196952 Transcript_74205/m.196952 type:complete len:848 (+) Transcript_74205:1282-3825(+)
MPSDHWQYHVQLHDVVHRHQHQQRKRPLLVVGPLGPLQQASTNDEALECVPISQLVKVLPFLEVALVRVLPLRALWLPTGVEAEAKSLLAVDVQPHEPEDREEGPDGALVLVVGRRAAARGGLGRGPAAGAGGAVDGARRRALHVGPRDAIQPELREGAAHVLVEHLAGVLGVQDAVGRAAGQLPVRPPPEHQLAEQQLVGPAHLQGLWGGHLAVPDGAEQAPRRPRGPGRGPLAARPDDLAVLVHGFEVRGLVLLLVVPSGATVVEGLPAPVRDCDLPLGVRHVLPREDEVVAARQAQEAPAPVLRVLDADVDLVDDVRRLQSRVRARESDVLGGPVGRLVDDQALLLLLRRDAQPREEHLRDGLPPHLLDLHAHGEGAASFDVLAPSGARVLGPQQQHVVQPQDLGVEPHLHDPDGAQQFPILARLERRHSLLVHLLVQVRERLPGELRDVDAPFLQHGRQLRLPIVHQARPRPCLHVRSFARDEVGAAREAHPVQLGGGLGRDVDHHGVLLVGGGNARDRLGVGALRREGVRAGPQVEQPRLLRLAQAELALEAAGDRPLPLAPVGLVQHHGEGLVPLPLPASSRALELYSQLPQLSVGTLDPHRDAHQLHHPLKPAVHGHQIRRVLLDDCVVELLQRLGVALPEPGGVHRVALQLCPEVRERHEALGARLGLRAALQDHGDLRASLRAGGRGHPADVGETVDVEAAAVGIARCPQLSQGYQAALRLLGNVDGILLRRALRQRAGARGRGPEVAAAAPAVPEGHRLEQADVHADAQGEAGRLLGGPAAQQLSHTHDGVGGTHLGVALSAPQDHAAGGIVFEQREAELPGYSANLGVEGEQPVRL